MSNTTMAGDGEAGEDNREFSEQAYLIPGVDGIRQFGFPNKIITKLRYAFNISTGPLTNGVGFDYVFRMNSIFDPDFTSIGHQPLWHDQYANIYLNYRVLGSQLRCKWMPSVYSYNGAYEPWIVGVTGNRVSTSLLGYTSAQELMELNDTSFDTIGVSGNKNTFVLNYSPASRMSTEATDDVAGAQMGASPTQTYFAHCWCFMENGNSAPATNGELSLTGTIEFTVEFFNLVNPAQS